MDYINKIKEACNNHQLPDIIWIEAVEDLLHKHKQYIVKYSKTENGKKKRREAQARYYQKKKLEKVQMVV